MKQAIKRIIIMATIGASAFAHAGEGARTDWFKDAGYGLFCCWSSQSVNADGSKKDYYTAVKEFDVAAFAGQVEEAGADLLVWFEPERVFAGSKLDQEHPERLLKNGTDSSRLLNLGEPKCRKWITDHVCRQIRENGIKIYRQDFNFAPLAFWRNGEAADRQGITENLYVQGYLQYWKDLLARNPGLWIDSCASGRR
ncbi:MAG: hypothetical protein FJ225_07850 [Lentisphaerae bacterium]|nr:hypothetical protein [Lentisphaerota bacterium]